MQSPPIPPRPPRNQPVPNRRPLATKHRIPASPMATARPCRRPDLGDGEVEQPWARLRGGHGRDRSTSPKSGPRESWWAQNGRMAMEEEMTAMAMRVAIMAGGGEGGSDGEVFGGGGSEE
ncbi:hypothetical protein NL676_039823 [Syzygium grande]|nr:hypothetical protein NL676_039823 [Syzygium grande]